MKFSQEDLPNFTKPEASVHKKFRWVHWTEQNRTGQIHVLTSWRRPWQQYKFSLKWPNETFNAIESHFKKSESYTSEHFILNLLNSQKARSIVFIWNDHSCKIRWWAQGCSTDAWFGDQTDDFYFKERQMGQMHRSKGVLYWKKCRSHIPVCELNPEFYERIELPSYILVYCANVIHLTDHLHLINFLQNLKLFADLSLTQASKDVEKMFNSTCRMPLWLLVPLF